MKIVFLGTPAFAVPTLKMLIKNHDVLLVVTQPDKPVGRKKKMMPSPIKEVALAHQIEVFQPIKLRKDYQKILDLKPDLLITAAYGQMLPKGLIENITSLNVHGSLLPKYRGGAPIQYALFNGDQQTGISIMYMAYKMDSGDVIKQEAITIEDHDNYQSLTNKLSILGAKLLDEVLIDLEKGIVNRYPQDESLVTFSPTIKYEDECINFHMTRDEIINKVRGLDPEPGAHFIYQSQRIKVYKAIKSDIINTQVKPGEIISVKKHLIIQTADKPIEILSIQIPGKKKMDAQSFLNGQSLFKKGEVIKEGVSHE